MRLGFVSISAALLLTALSLMWADPQWAHDHHWIIPALLCGGVLVFIPACFPQRWLEKPPAVKEEPLTFEQNTTGSHGPVGAVGSIGSVGSGAVINIGAVQENSQRSPQIPKRAPRLEFGGFQVRQLVALADPKAGVRVPITNDQRGGSFRALVLRVANLPKSDGTGSRAMQVSARLRFFSENWSRFADVDPAVWVGSPTDSTSIDVGKTCELFIVAQDQGTDGYSSLRDLRGDKLYHGPEEEVEYVDFISVNWFRYVEVIVTDQNSHVWIREMFSLRPIGSSWDSLLAYPPPTAQRMLT